LALPLAELQRGEAGLVTRLEASGFGPEHGNILLARLRDLGFVAGARCEVIARMWPAGDPLAVRVGGSTFALRRAEAAAVQVTRLAREPAVRAHLDTSAATA
jgi:ferrous iron transport protein A